MEKDKHSLIYVFGLELKLFGKWIYKNLKTIAAVLFGVVLFCVPGFFIYMDTKTRKDSFWNAFVVSIVLLAVLGIAFCLNELTEDVYYPDSSTGLTEIERKAFARKITYVTWTLIVLISIVLSIMLAPGYSQKLQTIPIGKGPDIAFYTGIPLLCFIVFSIVCSVLSVIDPFVALFAKWATNVRKDGQAEYVLSRIASYDKTSDLKS